MSCNENVHHKRSVSSGSGKKRAEYEIAPPPVPPPRSAPSTWRKPRRNVGDRVFISSPTTVYIDFVDENYRKTMELVSNNASTVEKNCENVQCDNVDFNKISENIRHSKDIPKIRNRIFEDSLESQEISFYIGVDSSDSDHHYESLFVNHDPDDDYDSFDSDTESERSFNKANLVCNPTCAIK